MKFLAVLVSLIFSFQSLASQENKNVIVLEPDSFIAFTDEVNEQSVSRFIRDFLSSEKDDIVVYVDSPGGSVLDGLRMIQAVTAGKAANPNLKVTCVVGSAASMAFYFLQLSCDERLVSSTTILMQHQAAVGVRGKMRDVNKVMKLYKSIGEWLDAASAKRMGMSVEKLKENIVDDWWMIGEEAISFKAADKVVSVICSKELTNKYPDPETMKPACPLIYGSVRTGKTVDKK